MSSRDSGILQSTKMSKVISALFLILISRDTYYCFLTESESCTENIKL